MRMIMGTIGSDKLSASLAKAKNIGLVEESFTLEGCDLTLRNLRPDEYVAALDGCKDLEEAAYLHGYQIEHIARSIVEVNGTDLRDVQFVEVDEEGPDGPRKVKLELHTYLINNLISTWGKEAVYTAYRKFTDVVETAEKKAQEGVKFLLPDETAEEKFRRLLLEAKDIEDELPDSLVDHILDESGFMRKTTAEEARAAMERADRMAREQEESQSAPEPPQAAPPEPAPEPPPQAQPAPQPAPEDRQPMNQAPGRPADPHKTLQEAIQARQQTTPPAPDTPAETSAASRADRIAALEAGAGAELPESLPGKDGQPIPVYRPPNQQEPEVMEIRKQAPVDAGKAGTILDKPPVAGVNPRFKPPPKV
jgi:hypothetical protein